MCVISVVILPTKLWLKWKIDRFVDPLFSESLRGQYIDTIGFRSRFLLCRFIKKRWLKKGLIIGNEKFSKESKTSLSDCFDYYHFYIHLWNRLTGFGIFSSSNFNHTIKQSAKTIFDRCLRRIFNHLEILLYAIEEPRYALKINRFPNATKNSVSSFRKSRKTEESNILFSFVTRSISFHSGCHLVLVAYLLIIKLYLENSPLYSLFRIKHFIQSSRIF